MAFQHLEQVQCEPIFKILQIPCALHILSLPFDYLVLSIRVPYPIRRTILPTRIICVFHPRSSAERGVSSGGWDSPPAMLIMSPLSDPVAEDSSICIVRKRLLLHCAATSNACLRSVVLCVWLGRRSCPFLFFLVGFFEHHSFGSEMMDGSPAIPFPCSHVQASCGVGKKCVVAPSTTLSFAGNRRAYWRPNVLKCFLTNRNVALRRCTSIVKSG